MMLSRGSPQAWFVRAPSADAVRGHRRAEAAARQPRCENARVSARATAASSVWIADVRVRRQLAKSLEELQQLVALAQTESRAQIVLETAMQIEHLDGELGAGRRQLDGATAQVVVARTARDQSSPLQLRH